LGSTTLPPFFRHASALLSSTNPFPLQSFLPLQASRPSHQRILPPSRAAVETIDAAHATVVN